MAWAELMLSQVYGMKGVTLSGRMVLAAFCLSRYHYGRVQLRDITVTDSIIMSLPPLLFDFVVSAGSHR